MKQPAQHPPGTPDAKRRILEAAAGIVESAGAAHLTIDAVAAAAGLSKGGVLYHFSTKRDLLQGMLLLLLETIRQRTNEMQAAAAGPSRHPALRSHLLAERVQAPGERALSLAILAAAAEDPSLLEPARAFAAELFERTTAGTGDPALAGIVLLATEGLRFMDMLNLTPYSDAQRDDIYRKLLSLIETLAVAPPTGDPSP